VQFTASEEHVKLVEQAKALLSHSALHAGLDEIHLRALRALVAELERQKYAVTARPRPRPRTGQSARGMSPQAAPARKTHEAHESEQASDSDVATELAHASERSLTMELAHECESALTMELAHECESVRPRRRGRHVPAGIRRAVYARDEARCTYTSDSGQRCSETHGLELHHSTPFSRGGAHSQRNLTLRCRAHNDLAAEKDFGRDFIEHARDSTEHEPWAVHGAGMPGR
jgi:5-methylcytosine-specific restriction endonuclease McrA